MGRQREALCRLRVGSNQSRRPQFPADPDNAIYQLVRRTGAPAALPVSVRTERCDACLLQQTAKVEKGQVAADMMAITKTPPDQAAIERLSKDPYYNSTMHTTCVATRLQAGHANNALPQRATANVNCRILPGTLARGDSAEAAARCGERPKDLPELCGAIGEVKVIMARRGKSHSPVRLSREVMFSRWRKWSAEMWPGAARDSDDGHRRFRRRVHESAGIADLRGQRAGHRQQRPARARDRTSGSLRGVLLQGRGFLLPLLESRDAVVRRIWWSEHANLRGVSLHQTCLRICLRS